MGKTLIIIAVLGVLALVFFAIKEGLNSTAKETNREQIDRLRRCETSDFEAFVAAYNSLTCDATIGKCENCRPYTAALLFTISDGILSRNSNYQTRKLLADKIFAFIESEKHFSQSELEIFDSAVLLYGKVINNEIAPRGDWQAAMSSGSAGDWLEKLFLCYGDLLKNPDYIHNYESAPVFIDDMDNTFRFAMALSAKEPLVIEYAAKISNL